MQVKEIEKLSPRELRQRADAVFAKADEKGPSYLIEAQFYMQELSRREDSKIARRDFRMELIVILLIGLEIVIALYEGHEQTNLIASQTQILQNLQTSTKNTADALTEELALEYKVSVNLGPNSDQLSIFNNSKNEITIWGMKIDGRPAKATPNSPISIPANGMANVMIERLYPAFFGKLSRTEYVGLPVTVYIKGSNSREYIVQSTFDFSGQGFKEIKGVPTVSRPQDWSDMISFSPGPSGSQEPSSRPQSSQ